MEHTIDSSVEQCEREYPNMTETFKKIQRTQYELFCKKSLDYGVENITVGTQLSSESDVKLSLTGLWFRLMDKMNRLKNIVVRNNKIHVEDESIIDTYIDSSNYCIISVLVYLKVFGK